MMTNKFYEDDYITNKIYSQIGGIDTSELLLLEIEFLSRMQWNMNINEEKFYQYSNKLQNSFYKPY